MQAGLELFLSLLKFLLLLVLMRSFAVTKTEVNALSVWIDALLELLLQEDLIKRNATGYFRKMQKSSLSSRISTLVGNVLQGRVLSGLVKFHLISKKDMTLEALTVLISKNSVKLTYR